MTEYEKIRSGYYLTEKEKKAIIELQDWYEYEYNKGNFDKCDVMVSVFCILNKHLSKQTGWEIHFDGSKADKLINVKGIPNEQTGI